MLTDSDDGEPLVAEDTVLSHRASRPVGSTVPQPLGESYGAGPERRKVVLAVVVGSEDTAPAKYAPISSRPCRDTPRVSHPRAMDSRSKGKGWKVFREGLSSHFGMVRAGLSSCGVLGVSGAVGRCVP